MLTKVIAPACMVLGYTLRSNKFEAIEEKMINEDLFPLLKGYYATFRNSTSVVGGLNFLQAYLSLDIGFSVEEDATTDFTEEG